MSSLPVPPPPSLAEGLKIPQKILAGPGPSNVSERVLQAHALPTIGHLHPEFCKVMDDIKAGTQYIFQTKNAMTLALSATGHAGMECVMTNMLEPGRTILIANNGIWGVRSKDMAERQGATVKEVTAETGSNFTLAELEAAVKEHKPDILFVTHGESSTGVVQPLEGIGAMCHANNCLFAVDTVASLGGVPLKADELEIDVIYTGRKSLLKLTLRIIAIAPVEHSFSSSQKVLGVPPGTAPISFSQRAVDSFKSRTRKPTSFYLDLDWLGEYWNCWPDKGRIYHHTGPVNAMYALREGLAIVAEEGLENCWRRHRLCADRLHEGIQELGLEFFVADPDKRLPTVTTIKVPEGVKWNEVTAYCMKNDLVEIAGGLGPSAGKVWRIGVMGNNASIKVVNQVLDSFGRALASVGWKK